MWCKYIILFLTLVTLTCSCSKSTIYYLDSKNGNDTNSGLSAESAWATLSKINNQRLMPGDKVLFKSGSIFYGQFLPKGSGEAENPILVTSYGEGDKPLIAGNGDVKSALKIYNNSYYEVSNLQITNWGNEREAGRYGVVIEAKNMGDCNHIYLNNIDVYHVNGSLIKKDGAGGAIYFSNGGDSISTRFVDLRIENCHLYQCGRNGITSWGNVDRNRWFPSIGVIIRNNLLEQIPGDGIVPIGCDGALVEHNIMRNCPDILPYGEAAAGIWPWSSDNTLIQHNEVSGHNAKWDGQGFDADYNCKNTTIQYNFSHDNAGGFILVCNDGNSLNRGYNMGTINTIIRYNLSVNDGIRTYPTKEAGHFAPSFHITGPCDGVNIYNNVIYVPTKTDCLIDRTIIEMGNWGGSWPSNTLFANNIFYALDTLNFNLGESLSTTFKSNLYFGVYTNLPNDSLPIYASPQFLLDTISDTVLLSPSYFKLSDSSICKNRGIPMASEVVDYFGVDVLKKPSIGISQ